MQEIVIAFTHEYDDAVRLRDMGYEPIECAFGQYGSVLGPLALDHHGTESHREGVAIRACRDHWGARRKDPRFVVTGTPDADAVLAIVALAGLVPREAVSAAFYETVARQDVDPIGFDLLAPEQTCGLDLSWFNQQPDVRPSEAGFRRAIAHMVHLLTHGLTDAERTAVRASDLARRKKALQGALGLWDLHGRPLPVIFDTSHLDSPVLRGETLSASPNRVLLVNGTVWGFDIWYRMAPIVVSFASRLERVTVGCPDIPTAERLLGEGGLLGVWPALGTGWGGRETIGGSPRGARLTLDDARATALRLVERVAGG